MTEATPSAAPRLWLGVLSMTFRVMVGSYALSSLGALLLHLFVTEATSDLAAFANSVIPLTFIPALLLAPLALLLRYRVLALLLLPVAAAWASWYGPRFLPPDVPPAPPGAPTLTVLSYNLYYANADYAGVERLLRQADADIVALQELSVAMANHLEAALYETYPHRALSPGGINGVGILSRYPIESVERWRSVLDNQRLVINAAGVPLVVYNVHPPSPINEDGFALRHSAVVDLLDRFDAESPDAVLLVLGDFNLTDRSADYAHLRDRFEDAFTTAGRGLGFTYALRGWVALARIDYVFYTPPLRALNAAPLPDRAGSDHHALRAELVIDPDPGA